jgi:predicted dehydrogenase
MNETESSNNLDFNRRDFLRSGSLATLMTMLGGVELIAQTTNAPAEAAYTGVKVKVGVVGLGPWGREVLNTLARVPMAEVAAVCDTYPALLRRGATAAPGAKAVDNFQAILDDKAIKCVVICTPTHQHRELVEAALKAGKHVYCEAPIAHTLEDAKAIAKASKAAPHLVFQAGLHMRSDKQRLFMLPFIRSGALGRNVFARAQWHKKQSWRATSPNPEREKAINWRLSQETSLGLVGEIGTHQIDQACWYLNMRPKSVTAFGGTILWQDGRDVPDTVQAIIEFPGNVQMIYDASLANSFDADYEMLFGSDAAVMMRGSKAWMFKEVDSPLLGWEVYAQKETFYKETGIALVAGGSKSVNQVEQQAEVPYTNTPLNYALTNFLRNANELGAAAEDFISTFGADDADALKEHLAKVPRQPAATLADGFAAAVVAIKTKEALATGQRVEIKPEMYELS